jgi:hypothetical protein
MYHSDAISHHFIQQFKREYKRREWDDDCLQEELNDLEEYTPDSHSQARQHDLRITAIKQMLNHEDSNRE